MLLLTERKKLYLDLFKILYLLLENNPGNISFSTSMDFKPKKKEWKGWIYVSRVLKVQCTGLDVKVLVQTINNSFFSWEISKYLHLICLMMWFQEVWIDYQYFLLWTCVSLFTSVIVYKNEPMYLSLIEVSFGTFRTIPCSWLWCFWAHSRGMGFWVWVVTGCVGKSPIF